MADIARQNEDQANQNAQQAEQSRKDTEKALEIVESEKAKALAAEGLARAEEPGEQPDGARMSGEGPEEHGAIDHRRVALEVVERHVRVGRRRQLGEQARKYGRE